MRTVLEQFKTELETLGGHVKACMENELPSQVIDLLESRQIAEHGYRLVCERHAEYVQADGHAPHVG